MTDADWLACRDPEPMLQHLLRLRGDDDGGERKLRLFSVACCRRVMRWLADDDRIRGAVELAERQAQGHASGSEVRFALARAGEAIDSLHAYQTVLRHVWEAARSALHPSAAEAAHGTMTSLAWAAQGGVWGEFHEARGRTQAVQCDLLREVFGPWAHPHPLASRDWPDEVVALARHIDEGRAYERMPDLGALLKRLPGGDCDPEMLRHCQQQQVEHVRGCWLLDLILRRRQ